jgi:GH18 family chitinase
VALEIRGGEEMNMQHYTRRSLVVACTLAFALGGVACSSSSDASESFGSSATSLVSSGVTLQTQLVPRFVGAQNNGGGAVTATATTAQAWETFSLEDVNGGALVSGDSVFVRAGNGQYWQALNGGGSSLSAASNNKLGWETFKLVRQAGSGTIVNGDIVGLQAASGAWVSAQNGGGAAVFAYGGALGSWERFKIGGLGTTTAPPTTPPPPTGTRVIGYVPNWYGSYASWASKLDFSKLTQLNLAFALGDANGNLQLASDADLKALVDAAHARGVKVFPSLCGGGGDDQIAPFYQPGQVDAFVDKIMAFTTRNHLDGIDVDVEAPDRMGASYDTFIAKLKAKASPLGLPVSAAVAQWMQYGMSDATLRSFDFINVMSYDNTGTWTGPGDHSSYAQAVDALGYYSARGVAKSKIVLGVPFYGYCWGNCGGSSSAYVLYKDILAKSASAGSGDWLELNGAQYSYNGTATMARKTALATQWGGIMIWEMGGDVPTSNGSSLLLSIGNALK